MTISLRRALGWTAASILGTGALAGAIVGLVLWLSADMRALTHQFLGAVRTRQDHLAYQLTTAELRARVPPAQFSAWLDASAPNARRSTSDWINGFAGGGGEECMEVWLYGQGELPGTIYLIIIKENGAWRVNDVALREPDLCDVD